MKVKNIKLNLNLNNKKVKELINKIETFKSSEVKKLINEKVDYFTREKKSLEIFIELSFCVLTANYDASKALKIEKAIDAGFLNYNEKELSEMLQTLGYRYPNVRSKFIIYNRKFYSNLKPALENLDNDLERREWLVKNIKGFGLKEASHFLRNNGYFNVAIIDFHILDLLNKYNLLESFLKNKLNDDLTIIKKDKTVSKKNIDNKKTKIKLNKELYLKTETILTELSRKVNLPLGILDLYLWYIETGKVIK